MHPVLKWLSRRPLRLLHVLGGGAGWLVYVFSPSYRRRLRANAALAGLNSQQRRAAVGQAGQMVLELPRLWLRPPDVAIEDPVSWDNAALVESGLDRGRGLILLAPHMGSFEMAGQAYAERYGQRKIMTAMFRPARQVWLRELELASRNRPGLATAPANVAGIRQLIRALRKGEVLGMLPDQVPPEGMGLWAPFFGQPAYTMTLVSRLVQQTGAALALIWVERQPQGRGYTVRIRPLPKPLPERPAQADDEQEKAWLLASATCINEAMEWAILQLPTQYLWGYHRYKQPRQDPAPGGPAA